MPFLRFPLRRVCTLSLCLLGLCAFPAATAFAAQSSLTECAGCGSALRKLAALTAEPGATRGEELTRLTADGRLDPVLFGAPGCNGPVQAVAVRSRIAYLGGHFSLCGDQPAANVVAFDIDTGSYASLGRGVDGAIDALHLDGERLYAAGRFSRAGASAAAGVAVWDGLDWQALVQSAAAIDAGGAVDLRALAFYGGKLHLAGRFDRIDGVAARNIARLGSAGWEPLAAGLDNRVNALAVHQGQLVAGGRFEHAGDLASPLAAFWDGGQWLAQPAESILAGPQTTVACTDPREIRALLSMDDQLVAVGLLRPLFRYLDTAAVIYRDGVWEPVQLPWGTTSGCTGGYTYSNGFAGLLLVDGEPWAFGRHGFGGDYHFVSSLDGERRLSLADPTLAAASAGVSTLLVGPQGRNGPLQELARDGDGVLRLTPLARARVSGSVRAVLEEGDGVIVAGEFSQVAGIMASNIAQWDGSDWTPLGGIAGNGVNGPIYALARYQGSLYVGGSFSSAGGVPAANIARWDGSHWHALESGVGVTQPYHPAAVQVLAEYAGELVVGGLFTSAGGIDVRALAQWNGSRWQPLRSGTDSIKPAYETVCLSPLSCVVAWNAVAVYGLQVHDGALYVSGLFNRVPGLPGFTHNGSGVLRWDGEALSSFGPESWNPDYFAATVYGNRKGRFNHSVPPVVLGGQLHFAFDPVAPSPGSLPPDARPYAAIGTWNPQHGDRYSEFVPGDLDLHRIDGLAVHGDRILVAGKLRSDPSARTSAIGILEGNRLRPLPAEGVFASATAPATLASAADALYAADLAFGRFPRVDFVDFDGGPEGRVRLSRDARKWVFEVAAAPPRIVRRHVDGRGEDLGALVLAAGLAAPGTGFTAPSVSADGLTAAFEGSDGHVYAVRANRPQRVSVAANGLAADGRSWGAALAPSGERLAFVSQARNLGGPADGQARIHLLDLVNGGIEVLQPPGVDPALADDGSVAYNADGHVIVSRPGANGRRHWTVSVSRVDGRPGDGASSSVQLTPDGRFGVFSSAAGNLLEGDGNGVADVFHFELGADATVALRRVSVDSFGRAGNAASLAPSISADGQWVAFHSAADNLVEVDRNDASDVFVHFLPTGETRRINGRHDFRADASGASQDAWLSGDGSTVAFNTTDVNLGAVLGEAVVASSVFAAPRRDTGHSARRWPESGRLPLPVDAASGCPGGYHIAVVEDGPLGGIQAGSWGLELLLQEPGRRVLAGGLNFGSLISAAQPGFAAFNIANAAAEPQRLLLALTGHGRNGRGESLPVRMEVQRQVGGQRETLYQRDLVIDMTRAFEYSLVLQPGFHVIVLHSRAASAPSGSAVGSFYLSATTEFLDRVGGGFQGGAVIGGYHDVLLGEASGFAGICLPEAGDLTARVTGLEAPSAGDLRLRLLDAQLRETVVVE